MSPAHFKISGREGERIRTSPSRDCLTSATAKATGRKCHLLRRLLFALASVGFVWYVRTLHVMHLNLGTNSVDRQSASRSFRVEGKNGLLASERWNGKQTNLEWANGDIIHIVHTRFMQHQGNFTELGIARARLFRTFCLPSMAIHGENPDLLWIIRTDPGLSNILANIMTDYLKQYPNFLLVKSHQNDVGWDLGFRDFRVAADALNGSLVLSGDTAVAQKFFESAQSAIVLETRLDADDALHRDSLGYLRQAARSVFLEERSISTPELLRSRERHHRKLQWLYWCARFGFHWHPAESLGSWGYISTKAETTCITPGLTLGYAVGVRLSHIPLVEHHKLHERIPKCRHEVETECLQVVQKVKPWALRARTATSAGMKGVHIEEGKEAAQVEIDDQEEMWQFLMVNMSIVREDVVLTNQYIRDHLAQIAIENLRGQCTMGHSCKKKSKEKLAKLIQLNYEFITT